MDKTYNKKIRNDGTTMQNWLGIIFLLYMGAVYPLIMHDRYFDITLTKYKAFEIGLCIYAVLMVLAVLLDVFDRKDPFAMFRRGRNILLTDWFMIGFFISNIVAFILAPDKLAAYTGSDGRRCGLQFMILAVILYICMGRTLVLKKSVLAAFMCVGTFASIVGVFQYIGIDFLEIREGLASSIQDIYISTFGNIDIFASFLCILIPVAIGAGLDNKKIYDRDAIWKFNWTKLSAWAAVYTGSAAVVVTNANLAYAGVGASILIAFLIAAYSGRLREFEELILIVFLGFLSVSIMLGMEPESLAKLDGLSNFARNITPIVWTVIALALVCAFVQIAEHIKPGISGRLRGRTPLIVCSVLVTVCVVCLVIGGSVKAGGIFRFDDSWGNYRGYVWKRLIEAYRDFPFVNKIFGYGNETVKDIMVSGYYDEMMSKIGVVYDNAHNEYLQYLVTTGAVGAITYIGLIVSAFVSMVRCAASKIRKGDEHNKEFCESTAIALGISGYAVQAFFNLNQSLTTPYIFLMVAMAAGIYRENRIRSNKIVK